MGNLKRPIIFIEKSKAKLKPDEIAAIVNSAVDQLCRAAEKGNA